MFSAQGSARWEGLADPRPAPTNDAIDRLRRGSLRVRLILLIAVTFVPMLILAMFGTSLHYERERRTAEQDLVVHAEMLAGTLDQQIGDTIAIIRTLASVSRPIDGAVAWLRVKLTEAIADRPALQILSIEPTVADGLPRSGDQGGGAGPPRFTSPLDRRDSNSSALGIAIPVMLGHEIPLTINVAVARSYFQGLLLAVSGPDGSVSGFIDQSYRVVARSRRSATFVGTDVIGPLRGALATHTAGFLRTQTVEGVEASIAYARAPMTGFAAAINLPSEIFDGPQREHALGLFAVAVLIAIVGTLLASALARQILNSLRRTVGELAAGVVPSSGFSEIVDLARMLQSTAGQRDSYAADLRRNREALLQILDALPVAILVADNHGRALFGNKRLHDDFDGASFETPADREQLHHPDDLPRLRVWRQSWLQGGDETPSPIAVRYNVRGEYRWHSFNAVTAGTISGGLRWYVSIAPDIHEEREARDALIRANASLEIRVVERTRTLADTAAKLETELRRVEQIMAALAQSQKREALARLTGGVAHDINNVLHVIGNSYTAIERTPTNGEKVRGAVAVGRTAVAHAAALIRNLTAFSRQQRVSTTALDPRTVLLEMAPLCRNALGAMCTLELDLDDDVAALGIDRGMFEAAVINLVTNARDAMPEGGRVIVAAHNAAGATAGDWNPLGPDAVAISVRDTGHGMSSDVVARATEPFFTTKADASGTGLGLAMVDGLVTRSGGKLDIASTPGAGTTVTMLLPRQESGEVPPEVPAVSPATWPPSVCATPRHTILLVDDNIPLLQSAALLLRAYGYRVIEASSPRAAIDLAAEHPDIDVVLADIVMPDGGGVAVAARLAGLRPALPVIFITGYADKTQVTGARLVLRKPIEVDTLRDAIEAAVPAKLCRSD